MTIPASGEISFSDFYYPEAPPTVSFGTAVTAGGPTASAPDLDFSETAGRFVVIWKEGSTGKAIVGSVSGTTPSFGTESQFTADNLTLYRGAISFNPNNSSQFIVVWRDYGNSYYPTAIVGTISGTSITYGTPVVIVAAARTEIVCAFDPSTSGKFIVTVKNGATASYAVVGTISGSSLSFGTPVSFLAGSAGYLQLAFDPNNAGKFALVFQDGTNSYYGTAIVGTMSGTSISFGTKAVYNSGGNTYWNTVAFAGSNKFVVAYSNGGNSSAGQLSVGTISGSSISFGSATVFLSTSTTPGKIAFDPYNANDFILVYRGAYQGTAISGQLIGSTFTLLTPVEYSPAGSIYSNFSWVAYDPNTEGRIVVTYQPTSGTYDDQARIRIGSLS